MKSAENFYDLMIRLRNQQKCFTFREAQITYLTSMKKSWNPSIQRCLEKAEMLGWFELGPAQDSLRLSFDAKQFLEAFITKGIRNFKNDNEREQKEGMMFFLSKFVSCVF